MAVRDAVLAALEDNRDAYISGEDLSQELGVSRAAISKAVKALRNAGYEIEAVTNRGYMMPSAGTSVSEAAVRNALPASLRDMALYVYDILDSTNLQARRIVLGEIPSSKGTPSDAEPAGSRKPSQQTAGNTAPVDKPAASAFPAVVIARQQTAGRGRLGRGFYSPRDGLYLSIVIKPTFDMSRASQVTVAAAAATSEAIDEICGCQSQIKWVNDIYVSNKKVCGILTEATTDFETGQIDSLIIGIGINTSDKSFPPELADIAGSVPSASGMPGEELTGHEKACLAAAVIDKVLRYTKDLDGFMESYRGRSLVIGRRITVYTGTYRKDPTQELGGRPAFAVGIDDTGGLMVEYDDGTRQTLTSGEVSIRL